MAYKSLNQESANLRGQILPTAYFYKQSIIGTLPHMFVYVQYCLWLLQCYKLQGGVEDCKAKNIYSWPFKPIHLCSKGLYLILTSPFTLPRWLCSSHRSLLAVPRYPRQASPQGHFSSSGKLPPQGHSLPMLLSLRGCNPHPHHQLRGLLVQLLGDFI